MWHKSFGLKAIVRTGVIAALYFVLTYALAPISYGPLQFRVSEAMTLIPVIFPEAAIGLTVGCVLANILSPFGWYDVVFGSAATLLAAVATALVGRFLRTDKLWLKGLVGAIPPILINAIVLPLVWVFLGTEQVFWLNFAFMLATQSGTVIVIGIPLLLGLGKIKNFLV